MRTKQLSNFLFLVPIIVVFVIKIPHLFLPYFWDEAWSYFPTIRKMAEMGPSLLPGAIPLEYSKGHPQFFLFLISSWMNLNPDSIPFLRLFPFILSIGLLFAIYWILKKEINQNAATIAVTLTAVQSVFLAQSTMIFPEILTTLLLLGTIFSFYKKKYAWYALISSLMVLTKETAIIFTLALGVFYLTGLLNNNIRRTFKWNQLLYMLMPGLTYIAFLLIHYNQFNTFFYTGHIGYIDLIWESIESKLIKESNLIFVHYGRRLITIIFLLLITIALILKKEIKHIRLLWIILACIVPFILFSAINFYTFRYMLPPLVLFVVGFSVFHSEVINSRLITAIITLSISATCLYYSLTNRNTDDHTLGYVEVVDVQKKLIQYCENNNYYDEPIAANFLLRVAFSDPGVGCKLTQKAFTQINPWTQYQQCKYFIYDRTPDVPDEIIKKVKSNFRLIKSFENKHAQGYIYENLNFLRNK